MKKRWLILLALTIITAMFANGTSDRYEVVAWQEDFESGATGWTHFDGSVSPNNWHIYNYGGAQANVWWMGDPALASGANIGGYYDHQYLVLDTPAQTLTSGNATLTFKMATALEAVGGTGDYNGWDSFNVRVSTNGGTTWTVLTPTAPAYDFTSSYAFGFEFGEGIGVPGYGGAHAAWTNASFNLSAYVGQSVKIRFAFASDPAYSTGDELGLYGVMVDDIAFGGYSNNGTDDGQMTWTSLVPLGGDIWNLSTDPAAPSPTHVYKCQNTSGTYNINMLDYLVSPPIQLPPDGAIRADFMIQGAFTDPNTFPDVDYFGWEISPNNGVTWYAMSNPYGSATGTNYVYSDAPDAWASMTASYDGVDGIISDYAGQTVKMRWYFKSDADTPQGIGIMIDDVKIYNDIFIAPAENLEATVNGSDVTLTWNAPGTGGGGEEGWLSYDGENADSIGTNGAADFGVAAKWDPAGTYGISPWVGMNITKMMIWPAEATSVATYTLRIWTGAEGTIAYEQAISPVADQWNEIILTTPFTIPAATQIMAGYRVNTTAGFPAGCDAGPQVEGYGNMMYWQNAWTTLSTVAASLTYNWNIRIYVEDAAGREYELSYYPQEIQPMSDAQFSAANGGAAETRNVTSYKVFRDNAQIDLIDGTLLTYTDANVPGGIHTYYLIAVYGTNDSEPSNTATAFVLPAESAELSHDDGTAEQGFNVGSTRQMAVKHHYGSPVTVSFAKVYVHTVGTAGIIVRVFEDDGANGMPGTQLAQYQYPAASVVEGWNWIALPADIVVPDGTFYLAILETTNASAIGLDTSSNGYSYQRLATTWEPVTTGEVMLRAIVAYTTDGDDPVVPVYTLDASNYPNPFNPETTIAFSVPADGQATLKVFNLKGQLVRTLVNDVRAAGNYSVVWNGQDDNRNNVSSGLYFYTVTSGGNTITRKMLLAK